MNESNLKHGAILKSPKKHIKIHRARKYVGQSSAPYDWSKPTVTGYTQPIKNQDQAGKCGGGMFANFKQIYNTLVLGKPFVELSMNSFYSQQYTRGGGMNTQGVQDGAGFTGLTTTLNCPDTVPCSESQAESTDWENVTKLQDCMLEAGLEMVSVRRDIDSIAQAIRDHKAVGFLFAGINNGSWLSPNPIPPTTAIGTWGHFWCSTTEIPIPINGKKIIPCYQTWGEKLADGTLVGDHGIQNFDETYINSGFIYDCFTFVRHIFNSDMGLGSFGQEVKFLQVRLGISPKTFGFGFYGPLTYKAVKAYQLANGLPSTGFCGPLTRAKLNS